MANVVGPVANVGVGEAPCMQGSQFARMSMLLTRCIPVFAALRYEDFEALLQQPPPREDTAAPAKMPSIPPSKINRPKGSVQTRGNTLSSSSQVPSSSFQSSVDEPAPTLMRPPKGFQQSAPAPSRADPAKPQEPAPALLGRPAKPPAVPDHPEEPEQQALQAGDSVLESQDKKEEQTRAPVLSKPPKADIQQAKDNELPEVQTKPHAKPKSGTPKAEPSNQQAKDDELPKVQTKPHAKPKQVESGIPEAEADGQQPQNNKMPEVQTKPHAKPKQVNSGTPEAEVPLQLSRPTLFPPKMQADVAPQTAASRPAPEDLPAVSRPVLRPEAVTPSVDEDDKEDLAAAQARLDRKLKFKLKRQTKRQTAAAARAASAAEAARAAEAAKAAALPPLELTSRPLPKKADDVNSADPTNWRVVDFDKFAAQNPHIAVKMSQTAWVRAAIKENKRLAQALQVPPPPPPPLAERPARPQPEPVGSEAAKDAALPPLDLISRPLPKKADDQESAASTSGRVDKSDRLAAQDPQNAAETSQTMWIKAAIKENKRLAEALQVPPLPPPPLAERPARPQPEPVGAEGRFQQSLTPLGEHT